MCVINATAVTAPKILLSALRKGQRTLPQLPAMGPTAVRSLCLSLQQNFNRNASCLVILGIALLGKSSLPLVSFLNITF